MGIAALLLETRWPLLAAVTALFVAKKIRDNNRLKDFKGPFSTGWSNLYHTGIIWGTESHIRYARLCEQYGAIARVGPNDLVTKDIDLIKRMSAARSPYTRAKWFHQATRVEPGKDHVFSQVDEVKHAKRRQQLAPGYSGKENEALEGSIDAHIQGFLQLIRKKYLSHAGRYNPMDLARKIQFLTMDVISEIGFGKAFGDVTADEDVDGYIESSEQGQRMMCKAVALGISRVLLIPWVGRLLLPSEKDERGYGKMMCAARKLIDSRYENLESGPRDMLSSFKRHGLSKDEMLTEAFLQIIAGADTTAALTRATFLLLMTHPTVYYALQKEIDNAVTAGKVAPPPSIIRESEMRALKYLQAVIKESLRHTPPLTDLLPKVVPPGGDTVDLDGKKVFLPGGVNVGLCTIGFLQDKRVFGDDVEVFRPERWLEAAENGTVESMNRTVDLVFGYGKYQCLGKTIGVMEVQKIVFELMRNFDFSLSSPEKPWTSTNHMGLFYQTDLWVRVTERQSGAV
ncbi:cytochrome P450 [Lineolata rhizophorae]|uniref:Cytochrome P450 monooxygenase ABA1 n=1 Tax=Lineolata rhizophorae TaxID=578093 RepID=A0A6A6NWX8_9PEZI|nr:cytochrome P450 [Lineolata rhizophorae]